MAKKSQDLNPKQFRFEKTICRWLLNHFWNDISAIFIDHLYGAAGGERIFETPGMYRAELIHGEKRAVDVNLLYIWQEGSFVVPVV